MNRPYCHNYGNITNSKEEGDPHKVGDRKQDMKSEEVKYKVTYQRVQDPIMDPKNPRFIVSFQILSMIEHVLFELFRRINLCNRSSVFTILQVQINNL